MTGKKIVFYLDGGFNQASTRNLLAITEGFLKRGHTVLVVTFLKDLHTDMLAISDRLSVKNHLLQETFIMKYLHERSQESAMWAIYYHSFLWVYSFWFKIKFPASVAVISNDYPSETSPPKLLNYFISIRYKTLIAQHTVGPRKVNLLGHLKGKEIRKKELKSLNTPIFRTLNVKKHLPKFNKRKHYLWNSRTLSIVAPLIKMSCRLPNKGAGASHTFFVIGQFFKTFNAQLGIPKNKLHVAGYVAEFSKDNDDNIRHEKKFITIMMQPFFRGTYCYSEELKQVAECLQYFYPNVTIAFKEHPKSYRNRAQLEEVARDLNCVKYIRNDKGITNKALLKQSYFSVMVNSTTLFESLHHGTPVVSYHMIENKLATENGNNWQDWNNEYHGMGIEGLSKVLKKVSLKQSVLDKICNAQIKSLRPYVNVTPDNQSLKNIVEYTEMLISSRSKKRH